ncbi:FAD-binding and (Fe-S)-binding domain-containing protein [Estrella lausannensis]|uniref:FAD linked oxidase n=1 Tax=Estrella lausannensis TaxID=483423 RepID=A0A0H5E579_9BACT|nr:FAD-binding and (Fe-S)-binding domain-containing protein [Estrella lausannensis]CRX38395.1 FAD linked oxidase [Estrella lausannensis]
MISPFFASGGRGSKIGSQDFIHDLKNAVAGLVKSDAATRIVYSQDASIFEIEPIAVFQPIHSEDIKAALKVAKEHGVPIIARGAATGITGGCLGRGLVIDLTRHLNRILDVNCEEGYAIVEPGVIQDDLNKHLEPFGLRLGPETSTGNRATVGGMLANNAAGSESLRFGCMADHILEVETLLADATSIVLKQMPYPSLPEHSPPLLSKIAKVRSSYEADIHSSYPKLPRISSGYRLDALTDSLDSINLAKLFAGSEGTLGIATKLKVKVVPRIKNKAMILAEFTTLKQAMKAVPLILKDAPFSLELIDDKIIDSAKKSRYLKRAMPLISNPKAVLAIQFDHEDPDLLRELIEEVAYRLRISLDDTHLSTVYDPRDIQAVLDTRKAGLGLLLSKRDYSRAVAFIEDLSVPPAKLPGFIEDFLNLMSSHNKDAGIYGHAGAGCLHIRPYVDLRHKTERMTMFKMMEETLQLIKRHGGVLSGEHGDGLIRTSFNKELFGKQIYQAFVEVKKAFDPGNILNPGKVVGDLSPLEHLRRYPDQDLPFEPFFDFSKEGGFDLSIDLCNGNGLCRKKEGVMCPSFQATRDEYDTTRARAEILRAWISGGKGFKVSDEDVLQVLDLCLMCKGCKKECPSQVDMAKIKAEVLYQNQHKMGTGIRSFLFGHMGLFLYGASMLWPLPQLLQGSSLERRFKKMMGIAEERSLPLPALRPFTELFRAKKPRGDAAKVILFNDTFNQYLSPHIGLKAASFLEAHGFSVVSPPYRCCGRTFISKGMLNEALGTAIRLVKTFYPYAQKGIPIIGIEPSCILTLRDEIPSLIQKQRPDLSPEAAAVAKAAMTFEEFLYGYLKEGGTILCKEPEKEVDVLLHTHCHDTAETGREPARSILKAVPFIKVQEAEEGCCGMAGSFGYEEEHFDLSMKIGELKLLPAVRRFTDSGVVVSNGTSCRSQIQFGTKKEALHMAELLHRYL